MNLHTLFQCSWWVAPPRNSIFHPDLDAFRMASTNIAFWNHLSSLRVTKPCLLTWARQRCILQVRFLTLYCCPEWVWRGALPALVLVYKSGQENSFGSSQLRHYGILLPCLPVVKDNSGWCSMIGAGSGVWRLLLSLEYSNCIYLMHFNNFTFCP